MTTKLAPWLALAVSDSLHQLAKLGFNPACDSCSQPMAVCDCASHNIEAHHTPRRTTRTQRRNLGG